MKTMLKLSMISALLISGLAGCGMPGDTIQVVRIALELPNGGYQDEEEMPAFGLLDLDHDPVDPRISTPQRPEGASPSFDGSGRPAEGVVVARWYDLQRAHGLFVGKWADAAGKLQGHFKGLYGRSRSQKGWVMYGKMVDRLGYPKGLISGTFHSGLFQARWVDSQGNLLGQLEGVSRRKSLHQGEMLGHWDRYPEPAPKAALAALAR